LATVIAGAVGRRAARPMRRTPPSTGRAFGSSAGQTRYANTNRLPASSGRSARGAVRRSMPISRRGRTSSAYASDRSTRRF
jgi:hypothetical protein